MPEIIRYEPDPYTVSTSPLQVFESEAIPVEPGTRFATSPRAECLAMARRFREGAITREEFLLWCTRVAGNLRDGDAADLIRLMGSVLAGDELPPE